MPPEPRQTGQGKARQVGFRHSAMSPAGQRDLEFHEPGQGVASYRSVCTRCILLRRHTRPRSAEDLALYVMYVRPPGIATTTGTVQFTAAAVSVIYQLIWYRPVPSLHVAADNQQQSKMAKHQGVVALALLLGTLAAIPTGTSTTVMHGRWRPRAIP